MLDKWKFLAEDRREGSVRAGMPKSLLPESPTMAAFGCAANFTAENGGKEAKKNASLL